MTLPGTGWSNRGGGKGVGDAGPVLHRVTMLRRYSRTGKTYRADCGTQVRYVDMSRPWSPGFDRACRACRVKAGS